MGSATRVNPIPTIQEPGNSTEQDGDADEKQESPMDPNSSIFTIPGMKRSRAGSTVSMYEVGDLVALNQLDTMVIRQIPQHMKRYENAPNKNKYQILTEAGEVIYTLLETSHKFNKELFPNDPFRLKIISSYKEYMCELIGDPGIGGLSAFVQVKQKDSLLGKVVQENPRFAFLSISPKYIVYNNREEIIYRITWERGTCCCTSINHSFQVYKAEKNFQLVSNIRRLKEPAVMDECFDDDMYHLRFQQLELDCVEKTLIIAATIMMDYQFFEGKTTTTSISMASKVKICVAVLLILLLLGGVGCFIYFAYVRSE